MAYLLVLGFLLTLGTMLYDFTSEPIAQAKLDGAILARQLVVQHSAASRACPTQADCADGAPINVSAFLGSYQAKASFGRTTGTFGSVRAGTRIVSYYKLNAPGGPRNRQVYGGVGAALAGLGPTANIRYVGYYHAGAISPGGQVSYRVQNPDHTQTLQYYSLPTVTVPGSFEEGTPLVATDLPTGSTSAVGSAAGTAPLVIPPLL